MYKDLSDPSLPIKYYQTEPMEIILDATYGMNIEFLVQNGLH